MDRVALIEPLPVSETMTSKETEDVYYDEQRSFFHPLNGTSRLDQEEPKNPVPHPELSMRSLDDHIERKRYYVFTGSSPKSLQSSTALSEESDNFELGATREGNMAAGDIRSDKNMSFFNHNLSPGGLETATPDTSDGLASGHEDDNSTTTHDDDDARSNNNCSSYSEQYTSTAVSNKRKDIRTNYPKDRFSKRVADVLEQRKQKLCRLKEQAISSELRNVTFHPEIDARSQRLWAARSKDQASVFERLHMLAKSRGVNFVSHNENCEGDVTSLIKFSTCDAKQQPLNILQKNRNKQGPHSNFFERMATDRVRREVHLAKLTEEMYPQLIKKSTTLKDIRPTRLYEEYVLKKSQEQKKTLSLGKDNIPENSISRTGLASYRPSEPYRPTLCPGSKIIAKSRTLKDLLAESKKKAEELSNLNRKQRDQKIYSSYNNTTKYECCSSKQNSYPVPSIMNIQRDFSRLYNQQNIQQKNILRTHWAELEAKKKEELELLECTFHPKINPKKSPHSSWIVEGVDNYMRHILMMRNMQMGQRERERKAFGMVASPLLSNQ